MVLLIVAFLASVISAMMYGIPKYSVYSHRLEGEALLAKSMAERQGQIQDAESKKIAATYLAQAEVERAKGVAEANRIVGESLKNNEAYLRWLWIHNLESSEKSGQVIYVPTEANLPILEAGHRR